jgi:hypothetical protein
MKMNKRVLTVGVVICALLILLSTATSRPVQAPETVQTGSSMEKYPIDPDVAQQIIAVMADMSIDVQSLSENVCIISAGNLSTTFERLETGYRLSSISDNGEIKTIDVTTETRHTDNTDLIERVVIINGTEIKIPTNKLVPP